jgi:NhaA family Na+:H+ antiporter
VSLLVGELAFGTGEADARVKIAALAGSLAAALLATMILRHQSETADSDHDGIPRPLPAALVLHRWHP